MLDSLDNNFIRSIAVFAKLRTDKSGSISKESKEPSLPHSLSSPIPVSSVAWRPQGRTGTISGVIFTPQTHLLIPRSRGRQSRSGGGGTGTFGPLLHHTGAGGRCRLVVMMWGTAGCPGQPALVLWADTSLHGHYLSSYQLS